MSASQQPFELRAVVVHPEAEARDLLVALLRERGHRASGLATIGSTLDPEGDEPAPAMVLVDDAAARAVAQAATSFRRLDGAVAPLVVALVPENHPERRVAALAAGADEVLPWPARADSVAVHLVAAERRIARRRERRSEHDRLRQLEKAVETMQIGVTITDLSRRILYSNPADALMHGWEPGELVGQDSRLFAPPGPLRHAEPLPFSTTVGRWKRESVNVRKDGSFFPVQVTSDLVRDEDGRPVAVVTCCEDISERKRAEQALRDSEERYALAARGAQDGLWDWDLRRDEVYYSDRWHEILGCASSELGNRPDGWFLRVHPADQHPLQDELTRHLRGDSERFQSVHRLQHHDGTYRWVLARGLAVRDPAGIAYRMAGSLSDLTGRGLHDPLTGLPNRAFFASRLASALERWKRHVDEGFAVLLVDVDRFQVINDSLGPVAGDQLLIEIARRLEQCLRASDSLARMDGTLTRAGGDEFLVLLEGLEGLADAIRVSERLQDSLRPAFEVGGGEVFTSVSIGIAVGAPAYERADELLRDAEIAMHRAKALGGARFQLFDKEMHDQALARLRVENELRGAIERDELVIHYQPIVDLQTGELTALEALVRWQHPEQRLLYPDRFIPIAEESDLILAIDQWVLRRVCTQLHALQREMGVDVQVNVNLSGRHFSRTHVVALVKQALADSSMPPRSLKLEVTEGTLMNNPELASQLLGELKALGILLCLDDFGTGYSSLSYLHRFPIDVLKVDRSFVGGISSGNQEDRIVEAIVRLGRQLGLEVVAEGVETAEQRDRLRAMGCHLAQGFFFARPLPWEAIRELIGRPLPYGGA